MFRCTKDTAWTSNICKAEMISVHSDRDKQTENELTASGMTSTWLRWYMTAVNRRRHLRCQED